MTTSSPKMFKTLLLTTITIAGFTFSSQANAQLEQQTIVADPGRIEETVKRERLMPQLGPDISIKQMALINAPAGAENIKFDFGGVNFIGLSTYSEDEFSKLYDNMLGQEVTLSDVYALANRMTLKYREDGYVLTQVVVPPQTIEDGIVQLQAVEGYIDQVVIQDNGLSPYELELLQEYASQISTGGALNIADLERNLLLINDLPGLTARSVISPSTTTPGAADIMIIPVRDMYQGLVSVNNFGSRFLGPVQFSGVGIANSPFGMNERLTAQVVAAPGQGFELAYGSLAYDQPFGSWGTVATLMGSYTKTDPGDTLAQFDVRGKASYFMAQVKQPIIRSRSTNLFGRVLFDYRDIDSKNNVELTRKDRIRAFRAGLQADFLDRLLGIAVNTFDFQLSRGVDVMGASEENDANLTRAAGDPQFTKANLYIKRLQRLSNDFNLVLEGRGQLSNNPLLSSEEFGLGGISTVRGYDPSEVVGDDGMAGKVELQWNTPSRQAQVFGFLDSGTVWNQDATTSSEKRNSLTSTGGGVRLDLPMDVDGELIMAVPLHRDIEAKHERGAQFFFSVSKSF